MTEQKTTGNALQDAYRTVVAKKAQAKLSEQFIVPEGWKLVPLEPTPEMKAAGQTTIHHLANDGIRRHWQDVYGEGYKAMLAATPTPHVATGEALRPTDDQLWDQTLSERDHYHEVADNLANAIAEYLSIDIGEHSSANCPWGNALDAIDDRVYSDTESMRKDAERYRWLTEDHSDRDTRTRCRGILDRMAVLSYSGACLEIDTAMKGK